MTVGRNSQMMDGRRGGRSLSSLCCSSLVLLLFLPITGLHEENMDEERGEKIRFSRRRGTLGCKKRMQRKTEEKEERERGWR